MADYSNFDDVLNELSISEGELNRLVSEGQLRAYRDEGNMKFRKEDIAAMRAGNMGGVGSSPAMSPTEMGRELDLNDETDETLLDLDDVSDDIDFEDTGETSVPTISLGTEGGDSDALTDELSFDDALDLDDGEATMISDDDLTLGDDELGLETEPLAGFDDADATMINDDEISLDDELSLGADDTLSLDGGGDFGAPGFMAPPMAAPQIQVQERFKYVEIVPNETMWTKIISGLLLVALVVGLFAAFNSNVLGTEAMGYNMFKGSGNENSIVKDLKRGDKPLTPGTSAVVSAGGNAAPNGAIYAGETLHRNENGKAHQIGESSK